MKNFKILFLVVVLIIGIFYNLFFKQTKMQLSSPVFPNEGIIPTKFTCDGEDINPPLMISDISENATSLVLIMDDPDAIKPAGKVRDHRIVRNISPDTIEIPENRNPEEYGATIGLNSWNKNEYGGPCPPDGEHTYIFRIYALDTKLNLPANTTKQELLEKIKNHILSEAVLKGKYSRK